MSGLESVEKEISQLNQDLHNVLNELSDIKKRQEKNNKAKQDALVFMEKAEKVIALAEEGKVQISEEQRRTIYSALIKIQKLFSGQ